MAFAPTLFIDIGATAAFYTLRETYEHVTYSRGAGDFGGAVHNGVYQGTCTREVRSFHHFNLSQDPAEAIEKAEECALNMGTPLQAVTVEQLGERLREIKRADAAELERREQQRLQWIAENAERRAAWDLERCELAARGVVPGRGGYAGQHLSEVPRSYINWLLDKRAEFELGSPMRVLAEHAEFFFTERALPAPSMATLAQPGKRVDVTATVVRTHRFERPCYPNTWQSEVVQITTMVEHTTGACLVVFSPTFRPAAESVLTLRGTVKEYKDFRGQPQTVLQRVKVAA